MDRPKPAISEHLESFYKGRVDVEYLRARMLAASMGEEVGGETPPQDQQIQEMIYNYLQSDVSGAGERAAKSFPPVLSWICVGRELTKFLATAPKASLQSLLESAQGSGFEVELPN